MSIRAELCSQIVLLVISGNKEPVSTVTLIVGRKGFSFILSSVPVRAYTEARGAPANNSWSGGPLVVMSLTQLETGNSILRQDQQRAEQADQLAQLAHQLALVER